MSADNGIYILITKRTRTQKNGVIINDGKEHNVYRIAHVAAIDNLDQYKVEQPHNLGAYMVDNWGKSKVYKDKSEALVNAHKLADSIKNLEYGVSIIDMSDMVFYGDM